LSIKKLQNEKKLFPYDVVFKRKCDIGVKLTHPNNQDKNNDSAEYNEF